jgi:hypothetical protein
MYSAIKHEGESNVGESGVRDNGNQRSERDGEQRRKYAELSLQGKWLAVARAWLEDNCPCTVEEYFLSVPQLMPTHIAQFRTSSYPQLSLAKSALSRSAKGYPASQQLPLIEIVDGQIRFLAKAKNMKYDYSWLPVNPCVGDEVNLTMTRKAQKERHAAIEQLRRRGYRRIGNGVYRFDPEHLTKQPDALQ